MGRYSFFILTAIITLNLSITAFAKNKNSGAGFILYHALTREEDRQSSKSLFYCGDYFQQKDLYVIQLSENPRPRIFTKIGANGDCVIHETLNDLRERHSCLVEELDFMYTTAENLRKETEASTEELARLGFLTADSRRGYELQLVIHSTDPRVRYINYRNSSWEWLNQWLPNSQSSCRLEIKIDQYAFDGQKKIKIKSITAASLRAEAQK